jgi:hypothetical protein
MTLSGRRVRVLVAVALAAASSFLLHCGGGTDIAPSSPVIEGEGFASATLAGRDFGASTQIDAGVSGVQNDVRTATDLLTIRPDGYGVLSHGLLASLIVTVTGASGTPTYCQGQNAGCVGVPTCAIPPSPVATIPCDFWVADATQGLLQVSPSGTLPAGTAVSASYSYNERLLTLSIGLTFPSGQFISLVVFNLPSDATASAGAPITIQTVLSAEPDDVGLARALHGDRRPGEPPHADGHRSLERGPALPCRDGHRPDDVRCRSHAGEPDRDVRDARLLTRRAGRKSGSSMARPSAAPGRSLPTSWHRRHALRRAVDADVQAPGAPSVSARRRWSRRTSRRRPRAPCGGRRRCRGRSDP